MVSNSTFKYDTYNLPPDLQRDILNLMMKNREFLIESCSLIKKEFFEDIAHQIICEECQLYFEKYNNVISHDVLRQEIRQKHSANRQVLRFETEVDLVEERSCHATQHKLYLKEKTIRWAKTQAIKLAIIRCADKIGDDIISDEDTDVMQEYMHEALMVAPNVSLGIDIFEDLDSSYRRIFSEQDGEKFMTGWRTIDRDLTGGLARKEIGMIFANAGVGKSLWLCKAAKKNLIENNKNVLYISCEMSDLRVRQRLDSMLTSLPHKELYNIETFPELEKRFKIIESCITNCTIKIKEFPAGEAKIADFRAYASQLYSYTGFKPDLVVLDYIDEVKCSKSNLSTYEAQYHTLREFRAWMSADNICGFTATQANRAGKQVKVITEGEIGDSYAKVRVVDAAWSLNQTDEEKRKNVARLYVAKHRNGRGKYIVPLSCDPDTFEMSEIEESAYERILEGKIPTEVTDEATIS